MDNFTILQLNAVSQVFLDALVDNKSLLQTLLDISALLTRLLTFDTFLLKFMFTLLKCIFYIFYFQIWWQCFLIRV